MQRRRKGNNCMKNKKNKFPNFDLMTREEETQWWDTHDLGDYWDELKDVDIVVDLKKPRDETLVVRMQKDIKDKLRNIAKNKGLDVSTLARMWIIERLHSL